MVFWTEDSQQQRTQTFFPSPKSRPTIPFRAQRKLLLMENVTLAMSSMQTFEFTIPSETSAGQDVQEKIIAQMEEAGFEDKDIFGMRLALEEGIVNAIKHGNRMDPDKQVFITCQIDETLVEVKIKDEGEGFVPEEVPDPTDDENLEKPCGRGIMLMKAFMDVIEYLENGTMLHLLKKRTLAS